MKFYCNRERAALTGRARAVICSTICLLVACTPDAIVPDCACVGDVPGGHIDLWCGEQTCLGDIGYRCTGVNTAVADPSACHPSFDTDSAAPEPDAGVLPLGDAGTAIRPEPDSGATDAGAASCPPEVWPPPAEAIRGLCDERLAECIRGGGSWECYDEQPPGCESCFSESLLACATERGGCDGAAGELECCLATECPSLTPDCLEMGGVCADQMDALYTCAIGVRETVCRDSGAECWERPPPGGCNGTASSMGRAAGGPVPVDRGRAYVASGSITMLLQQGSTSPGDRGLLLSLDPIPGQLSYPPASGLFKCGVIRRTPSSWAGVRAGLCELTLVELTYASAPGVCDGRILGAFRGVFGSDVLTGSIDLPLPVAEEEIVMSCRPPGARCTRHDQCCRRSCAPALGTCY